MADLRRRTETTFWHTPLSRHASNTRSEDLRPYQNRQARRRIALRIEGRRHVKATVGDRIVIKGHYMGEPIGDCQVVEAHGPDGGAPYLARWGDSRHETLFLAGSDAAETYESR